LRAFFYFLSLQNLALWKRNFLVGLPDMRAGFFILCSLGFLKKSRELVEKLRPGTSFFKPGPAGLKQSKRALEWSEKYGREYLFQGP